MDIIKINQYETFQKIGESTTSIIYKAFDSEKEIQVIVKLLKPSESIKRDIPKLKSYIGLQHKNISKIREIAHFEDSVIVVSDYVEGTPLQKMLINSEFKKEDTLGLVQQIADGLGKLHSNNLPHGNLKPSNIIITESGKAVLTDFGCTPFEGFQNSPEFVVPYEAFHYVSPEQVNNDPLCLQSDFFTLGVIVYRILVGSLPFTGDDEEALSKSILEHHPDLSNLGSDSHTRIVSLLLGRLLAKNRQDRFVDIPEILATLKEIQLIDKTSAKYAYLEESPSNPRKYLTLSVLAVLLAILWLALTLSS